MPTYHVLDMSLQYSAITDAEGNFCLYVFSEQYQVVPIISSDEVAAGLRLLPEIMFITVNEVCSACVDIQL